ncbi:organic hydroperoxide resistance protein [Amphibacillus indicireducens]|uniref:Organic hydroperoxide resistance protein n=1 Tax=Amphibacillus indicireducens TaxID=1076330 RepID=A0ABP7VMI3_9BACI
MSKVMFTSIATAKGGREGHVKSDDGIIDLKLVDPAADGNEKGSNPEQLFAAGYAACYDGALNLMASKQRKEIDSEITAEVSLMEDSDDKGVKIGVVLNVNIKGVSQEEVEKLANLAHDFCPYSKATRDNINVNLKVKAV